MGSCFSKKSTGDKEPQPPGAKTSTVKPQEVSASAPDASAMPAPSAQQQQRQQLSQDAQTPSAEMQKLEISTNQPASSTASSEVGARPRRDSCDRAAGPPSEDPRTPQDYTSSPLSTSRKPPTAPQQGGTNSQLTESKLQELNQASNTRRGQPSSTGGTTANTRPTDAPDLPDLADVPEATEVPMSPAAGGSASFTAGDVPAGTPPPVAEGLPVVSLQDIAVMEQKQGRRGRRMRSRRGSTTASHASLSAIPENVEITPLHARSERSDSMRVPMGGHVVSRLADVQELDVRHAASAFVVALPASQFRQVGKAECQREVGCNLIASMFPAVCMSGLHLLRSPCSGGRALSHFDCC